MATSFHGIPKQGVDMDKLNFFHVQEKILPPL